ncbi:MAG: hypothetical protein MK101_00840 [Phycisphaerales bacterium]|nr:hypothetical protein [Phycisphaerales bacterium]
MADESVSGETRAPAPPVELRFAFGGADIETVLDVVARAADMPMVHDTKIPQGTITFKSPETYDLSDGLRILNTILQTKGVTVRVDGDVLRLEKLENMQRANLPTFMNEVPLEITDDQLVTVMRPLRTATAEAMVERLSPMVGEYGQLIALPGQNAVVLTEMAGKARRLLGLLDEIDKQSPEGEVEVFPLEHVQADALIKPLTDLMSVKVEKYVPDKKGKLQKVEEVSLQGVSFSADARTNSIIAKGAHAGLDRMREIIALLDRPSSSADQDLRVVGLSLLTVDVAAKRLAPIIASMPESERPVLVPMPEQTSIGLAGASGRVQQLVDALAALEGSSTPVGEPVIEHIALSDAHATATLRALEQILPPVRRSRVRMAPGPDGRSLIVAGPATEVEAIKAVLPALDVRSREEIDVRVVQLPAGQAARLLDQARALDAQETDGASVDVAEDGTVVLTGPVTAVRRLHELVVKLHAAQPGTTETRRIALTSVRPSEIVSQLGTSLPLLLDGADEPGFEPPKFHPLDALQMLVIEAQGEHFDDIEKAVRLLDVPVELAEFEPLRSEPSQLVTTVRRLIDAGALGGQVHGLEILPDTRSQSVLISGRPADVRAAMELLKERDAATPLPIETALKAHDVTHGDPAALAPVLTAMLRDQARWPLSLRQARSAGTLVPLPNVVADPTAGRLMIDTPVDLQPLATALLKELDRPASDTGAVEIRVVQLERADATTVAMTVEASMAAKGRFNPAARQVVVQAEPSGNAVVLTGPVGELAQVQSLIQSLDEGVSAEASQVRTVYLEHARAERVAPVVEQLMGSETYTLAQRIEAARRRVALPEVRDSVKVAADPRLNAVVIVARPGVLPIAESLVTQLDVADQSARTARALHVVPVRHADATELSRTLQPLLADESSLSPPQVQVDRASNTLLVRGDEAQLARVRAVVGEIDQAALSAGRRLDVVPIDGSRIDAAELAATLRRLLQQHEGSMVEIVDLEDLLEREAAPEQTSSLPMTVPSWFAAVAFGGMQDQGDEAPSVSIAVDPETNSLVLLGGDRAVRRARAMLDQLMRQMPAAPGTLRRIDLKGTHDAGRLTTLLSQTLRTMTTPGGRRGDVASRVSILPDPSGDAIFITCSDADFQTVTEVLRAVAPSGPTAQTRIVKVIPLQQTQANVAAQQVREMLRAQAGTPGQVQRLVVEALGGEPVDASFRPEDVSVSGDARTGALIVSGPPESVPVLEQLVSLVDKSPITGQPALRLFDVTHAGVEDLGRTVQRLMRARYNARRATGIAATLPEVIADARTNTLLVTGGEAQLAEVEQLLEQLDVSTAVDLPPLEAIELTSARPSQIARLVQQALLASDPASASTVTVVPDDASGLLLVRADEAMRTHIQSLIEQLDRSRDEQFDIRTISLERADAGLVAQAIQKLHDDRARISGGKRAVTVIGDQGSRTLLVAAADDDFEAVKELASRLDSPASHEQFRIQAYPLEHAKAAEVANTVQNMVMQLAYGSQVFGGWMGRSRGGELPGRLAVFPDLRLNALVVTGHGETFDIVEQVVAVIDAASPEGAERTVKTYHVAGTSMETVQGMVRDLYGGGSRAWWEARDETAPVVRLDEKHRVLIVAGNAAQHEEIGELLDVLDTWAVGDRSIVRTFPLDEARARDVVRVLNDSLGLRGDGSASNTVITLEEGADPVEIRARIVADERSNSLVVTASAESIPIIESMISDLDSVPTVAEVEYHLVSLEHAIASDVRWSLEQITYSMPRPRPEIDADRNANQLIIAATPAQFEQLQKLIAKLDQPPVSTRETKFLALQHAEADKVRQALTVFYGPYALEADTPSKMNVSIVADPSTNSLVVSAEESEWEGIEALIAELDNEAYDASLQVRVLPLQHAEAASVARAINEAFSREVTQRGRRPRPRQSNSGNGDREAEVPTMLVQSEEWVSASAEPVTNSVVVAATGRTLERIETIVQSLDQPNTSVDVTVHVITLEDSPVARVADTLRGTFAERADQLRVPLTIEHDAMTNSLVVATSGTLAQEIRSTASQLDGMMPASGHGVTVIELQHIAPPEAIRVIESLGLHRPPRNNSMSRLVNEPVRVTHLDGRNAVMVLSNPADTDTVVDILRAVDEAPVGASATMQIIELQHTRAEDMADVLEDLLDPSDQQVGTELARAIEEQVRRLDLRHQEVGRGLVELDLSQPIRIVPHEIQNALVVTSTTANVLAIDALVDLLDSLPVSGAAVIRVMPLENIAAEDFRRIVQDVFDQSDGLSMLPGTDIPARPGGAVGSALLDDIAMSVDERTNTVIVAGREDAVATVEVLVERLDSDMASGWLEVQVVPLVHADPSDMADTLHRVLVEGATDQPNAGPMQHQVGRLRVAAGGDSVDAEIFQPMHRLALVPEPALDSLVVVGSAANIQVVSELIRMLDVEGASPASSVRMYPVAHATASQLANMLDRLIAGQLRSGALDDEDAAVIQADARTNTLVVSSSEKVFTIVESLLVTLDTDEAPEFQEIRTIALESASATRVSSLVQQMMDARVDRLRAVEPEAAAMERAVVLADEVSNSLVVAASAGGFTVIEQMIERLDGAAYVGSALVEVIDAGTSSAPRLAETIRTVMERRYADLPADMRRRQMPLVQVDTRTDSLLVSAAPDDLNAIRDLVDKLDAVPVSPAIGLHVLPVGGSGNAERLAPRIEQLMRERAASLGEAQSPTDRVSVEFETSINSLIVSASNENLVVIEELLRMLVDAEQTGDDGRIVDVIPLSIGQADEVARLLDDLYVREANRTRGDGTVRVSADRGLNSILVNAPPRDAAEIRDLIERLEGTSPADVLEIRHIPLSSANAIETVSLIEDVLAGRSIGRSRSRQLRSTVLRYVSEAAEREGAEEMAITTALRETINLTPDIRTNTVIIRAPGDSMQMLIDMIRDLDETSTGSKSLRVFTLTNADATAMRSILRDLFRLDEGQDLLVLKPRDGQVIPPVPVSGDGALTPENLDSATFGPGLGGTELTAVPDPRQQLAITVDTRTNSLLVSGSPAYLDLVEQVVQSLDTVEANERETLVYQLRNATAEEVSRVLGEFVEEEQRTLVETLGVDQLGSAARMLEREVTIRGDAKSNSVLVSASPRYMERVKDMIDALDVDPPQVLIQVLLAEVSLEGGVNWGIQFEGGPIGGASVEAGYRLPVANAGTPLLGALAMPTLALGSSDFSLVLEALESQGRLHILSNPSIMAANNEQATINVGELIYVAQGAQTYDTGVISVPLEEKDVGVSLVVTPSINPDGFVRLDVQPTLSKLLQQTDEPAVGVTSPRILQRTADTTITVHDGQTVVIGGLINESYEEFQDKVPFLGDIPLLGLLFRSESSQLVRNELVIVLTPHVVRSPADFDRVRDLTEGEVERLTLPEAMQDQIEAGQLERESLFIREDGVLKVRDLDALEAGDTSTEPEP